MFYNKWERCPQGNEPENLSGSCCGSVYKEHSKTCLMERERGAGPMSQELLMRHNPPSSAAGDPKVNGSWGLGLGGVQTPLQKQSLSLCRVAPVGVLSVTELFASQASNCGDSEGLF